MAAFKAVTQGVLDSGMVMVYMTPNIPGTVELEFYFSSTTTTATPPTLATYAMATYTFKLVAVTGSIATSMQKNKIDHSNYAQVASFLGL